MRTILVLYDSVHVHRWICESLLWVIWSMVIKFPVCSDIGQCKMSHINGVRWAIQMWTAPRRPAIWCNYALIKNHLVDSCSSKWTRLVQRHSQLRRRSCFFLLLQCVQPRQRQRTVPEMHYGRCVWALNVRGDAQYVLRCILGNRKECKRTNQCAALLFSSLCRKTGW